MSLFSSTGLQWFSNGSVHWFPEGTDGFYEEAAQEFDGGEEEDLEEEDSDHDITSSDDDDDDDEDRNDPLFVPSGRGGVGEGRSKAPKTRAGVKTEEQEEWVIRAYYLACAADTR